MLRAAAPARTVGTGPSPSLPFRARQSRHREGPMHIDMLAVTAAAAQSFDVEAATRAYLETLQGAARAKSDAYFEGGYWLLLWNALVGVAAAWVMLRLGWSAAWEIGRASVGKECRSRWAP